MSESGLTNMLIICSFFSTSEPEYAYKRYAYKKNMYLIRINFGAD